MESRPSWWDRANCAGTGPSLWFPELVAEGGAKRDATDLYVEARKVCAGCEVREECLEVGMTEHFYGIFGGLTPKERRSLRSQRHQSSNLASA